MVFRSHQERSTALSQMQLSDHLSRLAGASVAGAASMTTRGERCDNASPSSRGSRNGSKRLHVFIRDSKHRYTAGYIRISHLADNQFFFVFLKSVTPHLPNKAFAILFYV